jgi:FAD/FMN-containing dehydrogenase
VITGAVLRLAPRMQSRAACWLGFASVNQALEVATRIRAAFGTLVEALELIDRAEASYVVRHFPDIRMPLAALPDWSLMVQLASSRADDDLVPQLETLLATAMDEGLIADAVVAQNETQAENIWHFRHSVTEANKLTGVGVVLDTSVRPSEVAGFIADADRVAAARFPQAERATVAHLADGNVHYILMFPRDFWTALPDKEAMELEVERAIHDVAIAHGGSFSAEHGIGRKLTEEMARLVDPVRLELMAGIRAVFDPQGLMNPGALLPPGG